MSDSKKDIHPLDTSIKKVSGGELTPKERISAAHKASFEAPVSDFTKKMQHLGKVSTGEAEKVAKTQKAVERSYKPSPKEIEKHFGFIPAVNIPLRRDRDTINPNERRPDVPELRVSGLPSQTVYAKAGTEPGEEKKLKKATGPKLAVCKTCGGKVTHHGVTAAGRAIAPELRKPEHYTHARVRAGTSSVASKPSRPPNFSLAGSSRANKPSTQTASAILAAKGAVGISGSEKRDIKNRNIELPKPKEEEDIIKNMLDFLAEAKLHMDWDTVHKHGIFKFDPTKSTFEPLKTKAPLPQGASSSEKEKMLTDVEKASANLGIVGGKIRNPKPSGLAAAKKELFGENDMNPDKIANDIIREAFTSGDRNNTTPADNSMSDKGGTARKMLAGEFFGSAAWPFDQSENPMYAGSADLQDKQSHSGMGDGYGCGFQEEVGREIVDNLLEDSPSAIYSDTESVGYLINELTESGYTEYAKTIAAICEDAKEEDIVKVVEMIEKMEADKADPFLIEQLAKFGNLLVEDDMNTTNDANPSDPNLDKEDAASKVDTGEDTGGSGL